MTIECEWTAFFMFKQPTLIFYRPIGTNKNATNIHLLYICIGWQWGGWGLINIIAPGR